MQDYEGLARRAVSAISVPASLADWEDELQGAALLGIAEALSEYAQPTEALLCSRAQSRAVDELRRESRRRGGKLGRDGSVEHHCKQVSADAYEIADEVVDDGTANPPRDLETDELITIIGQERKRLPSDERTALYLRFDEGLTMAQIAQRTGASVGRVDGLLASAIDKLRRRMGVSAGEG